MSREWKIYVGDMLACCDRVMAYTDGVSRETFDERGMVFDATVRNLELLGEAANQLPDEVSAEAPGIEWRKLIGLRNVLRWRSQMRGSERTDRSEVDRNGGGWRRV